MIVSIAFEFIPSQSQDPYADITIRILSFRMNGMKGETTKLNSIFIYFVMKSVKRTMEIMKVTVNEMHTKAIVFIQCAAMTTIIIIWENEEILKTTSDIVDYKALPSIRTGKRIFAKKSFKGVDEGN